MDGYKVDFVQLLRCMIYAKDLEPLLRQLLWYCCSSVEALLAKSMGNEKPCPDASHCEVVSLSDNRWDRQKLDSHLLKYVVSNMEATRGHTTFSIAYDKANVGGLTMGNCVVALPTHSAWVGIPQALGLVC